jgi:hypothetical protein
MIDFDLYDFLQHVARIFRGVLLCGSLKIWVFLSGGF